MYLIAAVIFMVCFARPSHCLWLKKTVRRGGPEPREAVVQRTETQKGRIVFGRVFERDAAAAGDRAEYSHAGDETTYQGDEPGRRKSS